MPSGFRPHAHRFPLHVHISVLFILLLLLAGGALGLFNYRQTTAIIFSSSATLFERIQQDVQRDIGATYQPIRHLLGVLAFAEGTRGDDLQTRQPLLAPFAQALRDNPKLAAVYLGYRNGDFFMVRALRERSVQRQFEAPPGAAFQIWSIERQGDSRAGEYLFYDDALKLLERRAANGQDYDPRDREWYVRARAENARISTTPYVFFSSGAIGTTLATPAGDDGVLAADLTLEQLSATLIKHKVTPDSEVLLFDARGVAVAYPDSRRLIREDPEPHLARVRDLLPTLAGALEELEADGDQQRIVNLDKRRWVVSRSQLGEGGPAGLYLALLVPEDELLADAYRIRWQGALVTLTTLLLCLPLGWLASRCITRPLGALQAQSEAMGRFAFAAADGVRSSVLEVDRLALAMTRMNRSITRYQGIVVELGQQPDIDSLLQRTLHESIDAVQADAGILYLLEDGQLQPHGLRLDGVAQAPGRHDLLAHALDRTLPPWLRQALDGSSAALSLGFDKAGDYQTLLNSLGSPRVDLVAVALRDRQDETLGLLVLLQREEPLEAHPGIRSAACIAFSEAVAKIAALHLHNRRMMPES